MTTIETDNHSSVADGAPGIDNAIAWYQSIQDMTSRLREVEDAEDYDTSENIRTEIMDSALSVQVRADWYTPGLHGVDHPPVEYSILLTTGGPALRLIGTLTEYGEPETARLEAQDWGTSWADVSRNQIFNNKCISVREAGKAWEDYDNTLLAFARCFYFAD